MARLHLEHELVVVPPTKQYSAEIVSWLQGSAHHVELVPSLGTCEQTLPTVFRRAHFSVFLVSIAIILHLHLFHLLLSHSPLQLLGGGVATLNSTLSQLLLPVVHDSSDLVVADISRVIPPSFSHCLLSSLLSFLPFIYAFPSSLPLSFSHPPFPPFLLFFPSFNP